MRRDVKQQHRMPQTYTTLDGRVLDLGDLPQDERAFFERCYGAYRAREDWEAFTRIARTENPVIRAAGGRITQAVWDHPLFQAVHDLEDRLGIEQGEFLPSPGDDLASDPLVDRWVPAPAAAAQKGVSLPGLHGAIKRGRLIAWRDHGGTDGTDRVLVSANSLARWTPDRMRQAARSRTAQASRS
jgi:hypothetical protein